MASFNSASVFAFFSALEVSTLAMEALLEIILRELSCKDLSPLGILPRATGSLASRFRPGMVAGVADRILANTSFGRRVGFRLSWSLQSTFSSDLGTVAGACLFATDPGFAGAFGAAVAIYFLGFGGEMTTGPPNLWFRDLHSSGSRPAKLSWSAFHAVWFIWGPHLQG